MTARAVSVVLAVATIIAGSSIGCGRSTPPEARNIEQFAVWYNVMGERSPDRIGPSDFADYEAYWTEVREDEPDLQFEAWLQEIKNGNVAVIWNAKTLDNFWQQYGKRHEPAQTRQPIIAYETSVVTTGGWVVLIDGRTERMTPEQFKRAAKAATIE